MQTAGYNGKSRYQTGQELNKIHQCGTVNVTFLIAFTFSYVSHAKYFSISNTNLRIVILFTFFTNY